MDDTERKRIRKSRQERYTHSFVPVWVSDALKAESAKHDFSISHYFRRTLQQYICYGLSKDQKQQATSKKTPHVTVATWLGAVDKEPLKKMAAEKDMSLSSYIKELLTEHVKNLGYKAPENEEE